VISQESLNIFPKRFQCYIRCIFASIHKFCRDIFMLVIMTSNRRKRC